MAPQLPVDTLNEAKRSVLETSPPAGAIGFCCGLVAAGARPELVERVLQTQARVAEYMKQHLAEPLSIAQLASRASISKPHFGRCF